MQWNIFVAGLPIAQPRTRATAISGHARLYTPNNGIRAWKQSIQIAARQVWHGEPMTGPMRVDCRFVFPRVDAQIWKRKPMPAIWHCKKPDRDNLDKAFLMLSLVYFGSTIVRSAMVELKSTLQAVTTCQECISRLHDWEH
jgi:Holliday junction resolvase RusA-like endonuclease